MERKSLPVALAFCVCSVLQKSRLSGVAGKVTKKSDRAENTNKKSTKGELRLWLLWAYMG